MVEVSSGRPHYARDGAGELAVALGLASQLLAASGCQFIEAGAAIVGRNAPFPLDPTVQLQSLQRRIERAFFNAQNVVGQLLNKLSDGIAVQMAACEGLSTSMSSVP
jgi:hypothetical protein